MTHTLKSTGTEEGQAGLQRLELNLHLKAVDLHGAEDLTHGHVRLIQSGHPADTETRLDPALAAHETEERTTSGSKLSQTMCLSSL